MLEECIEYTVGEEAKAIALLSRHGTPGIGQGILICEDPTQIGILTLARSLAALPMLTPTAPTRPIFPAPPRPVGLEAGVALGICGRRVAQCLRVFARGPGKEGQWMLLAPAIDLDQLGQLFPGPGDKVEDDMARALPTVGAAEEVALRRDAFGSASVLGQQAECEMPNPLAEFPGTAEG